MDFTLTPAARKFIGLMLRLSGVAGSGFRQPVGGVHAH